MPLDKKSMATERPLKLFLSFLLFVNRTMIDHYIDFFRFFAIFVVVYLQYNIIHERTT